MSFNNEDNETETTKFYLDEPVFSESMIKSLTTPCREPVAKELPKNADQLSFSVEDDTGFVHCKKSDIIVDDKYIDGYYVKTSDARLEEACQMAYFFDSLDKTQTTFMLTLQEEIEALRTARGYCSLADILLILVERRNKHIISGFVDDLIVLPRLRHMMKMMRMHQNAENEIMALKDVKFLDQHAYVVFAIMFLAFQFAGGSRVLVYDNQLFNGLSVMLFGQRLWHALHLAVPRLNTLCRTTFTSRIRVFNYIPHAAQYEMEAFARVAWIAFRNSVEMSSAAIVANLRNTTSEEKLDEGCRKWLATTKVPNVEKIMRKGGEEKRLLFDRYLFNCSFGCILRDVPTTINSIQNFEESAKKYSLDSVTLYLAKSVLEIEMIERNRDVFETMEKSKMARGPPAPSGPPSQSSQSSASVPSAPLAPPAPPAPSAPPAPTSAASSSTNNSKKKSAAAAAADLI